jgi:hypothetical protein
MSDMSQSGWAPGEHLDAMRDDGAISVFWDGFHAGIGWLFFQDERELYEYAIYQASEKVLGDKNYWDDTYDQILELKRGLEDGAGDVESVKAFLISFDKLTKGSNVSATHKVMTYKDLLSDNSMRKEYEEYVMEMEEEGRPATCRIEDSHTIAEEMLIGRYDEPYTFSPPDDED